VATVTDIRLGLAENLRQLGNDTGIQISPYALSSPTPPAIQILPGEILYDQAFRRGLDVLTLLIQAFVSFTSDIGSQTRLDELLDPTGAHSLKTAVESDSTLGNLVADVSVTNATGYRVAQGANGPILLCEWSVQVYAQN
jgi:hypothetical protein